jgi:hypothetical protein
MTYRDIHGPITAEIAEREPETQRLFSRPARRPSPATRALLKRQEVEHARTQVSSSRVSTH